MIDQCCGRILCDDFPCIGCPVAFGARREFSIGYRVVDDMYEIESLVPVAPAGRYVPRAVQSNHTCPAARWPADITCPPRALRRLES